MGQNMFIKIDEIEAELVKKNFGYEQVRGAIKLILPVLFVGFNCLGNEDSFLNKKYHNDTPYENKIECCRTGRPIEHNIRLINQFDSTLVTTIATGTETAIFNLDLGK